MNQNIAIIELYQRFLKCSSISIDTRTIQAGAMFFALRTERFDANQLANEALQKGAVCIVIDNPAYTNSQTVVVADVLKALQELAAHHRHSLGTPLIALTGSNGKTTTKELLAAVLNKKMNTLYTFGNLNNHIGVPLTLLRLRAEHELGIIEMGANHQGEIAQLCEIASPDEGMVTNMGKAHLEGFGGEEGVRKGKGEMYDYLIKNNKRIWVNADDAVLMQELNKKNATNTISYGESEQARYKMKFWIHDNTNKITIENTEIHSKLYGAYNNPNIAFAIAVGLHYNVEIEAIKNAIEQYTPDNNRSQTETINSNQWILDAYNANPSSMLAAIEEFSRLHNKANNYMILGDMFELGADAEAEHLKTVTLANAVFNGIKIWVGPEFCAAATQYDDTNNLGFTTTDEATEWITNQPIANAVILLKGSRSMGLEKIIKKIKSL